MKSSKNYTDTGRLFDKLVRETFRLNGRMLAVGDAMTKDLGLTSSRWQVLGAIAGAAHPLTVPSVGRNMNLPRQTVQRIVDLLEAEQLIAFEDNPHHRKAKLVVLTEAGREVYQKISGIQTVWANNMSTGFSEEELTTAVDVLKRIRLQLKA